MGETEKAFAAFEALLSGKWESRFGDLKSQVKPVLIDLFGKRIASATSADEKAGLRKKAAAMGITELGIHELKILMSWDTATDIDLYVTDPKGEVVSYQKKTSSSGAVYFVDDTDGYGPETYALAKAPAGIYKVEANYCGGSGRTTVRFTVIVHEGTEREVRREESFVLENNRERKAIADVIVK
jgi:uncharacterized protein YfaP (DUF2135 family)